jgi:lambda family phage portal protein
MIGSTIDRLVGLFSPAAAVRRTQQRRTLERMYQGAEANRLTNNKKPKNQSADSELLGPFGADSLRAWSRALVRDNAYAWGVVDTIVSSVVGSGITAQSQVETPEGTDIEDVNELRDKVWSEWCEVCDVNGRLSFAEIQQLAQREMVEAGEVLIHFVNTPSEKYRGIYRPVPLAIELIEADRLANEKDTYKVRSADSNRITRGVELDDLGKPLAYWIYPEHPNGPYTQGRQEPVRVDAKNILHLYRMDRIGQSRGVSWFAPVMSWLRDLGVYVDNEIQASAVASCFGVAIKTEGRAGTGLMPSTDSESTDDNGNGFEYLEPAMVVRLRPGESVESINPGRPNSASEPWINLMLRGISVGTGLSYEVVSRNYSGTSYSSSRTSMLEDRRRFRRWQKYMVQHCCQPIWDRFCEQAATAGVDGFPSMSEVLDDRRAATAVEWQTPAWEWVDPQSEQAASDAALTSFQSTYQDELGQRGKNWRNVFYQRAKEEKLKRSLGLVTADMANVESAQAEAQQMAATGAAASGDTTAQQPAGEMSDMSRMQWSRNRKAIEDILAELIAGTASETKARVFLQTLGLTEATASALITDAMDGTVDTDLSQEPATEQNQESETIDRMVHRKGGQWVTTEDGNRLFLNEGALSTKPGGKKIDAGTEALKTVSDTKSDQPAKKKDTKSDAKPQAKAELKPQTQPEAKTKAKPADAANKSPAEQASSKSSIESGKQVEYQIDRKTSRPTREEKAWAYEQKKDLYKRKAVASWSGEEYKSIREETAKGTPSENTKKFLEVIESAPKFEGEVYRGMKVTKESAPKLQAMLNAGVGATFKDDAPFSTSRNPKIASDFAEGGVMMKLKVKSGARIEHVNGNYRGEMEVISRPGTTYRIDRIVKSPSINGKPAKVLVEVSEV